MGDLEITKLCAEAMDLHFPWDEMPRRFTAATDYKGPVIEYDPLHDDAHAMALVKKFHLRIEPSTHSVTGEFQWHVWKYPHAILLGLSPDLNRAICECVAKMQLAKNEADKHFGQPHYGHNSNEPI